MNRAEATHIARAYMATLEVPRVLKKIGEEARRNGTSKLTSAQIDAIIADTRRKKRLEQS